MTYKQKVFANKQAPLFAQIIYDKYKQYDSDLVLTALIQVVEMGIEKDSDLVGQEICESMFIAVRVNQQRFSEMYRLFRAEVTFAEMNEMSKEIDWKETLQHIK